MADRIPLIVNSTVSQIQELPTADNLVLSGQLKLTGTTTTGASDVILSGGSDGIAVITVSENNGSNVSKLVIDGKGSGGHGGVNGAGKIAEFIMTGTTPSVDITGALNVQSSTTSTNKTTGALVVTGGVGIGGALNVGGDITAFASSDVTLKENITPISNAVDKVRSISGNTFTWNKKSVYNGEEGTGIIAQEIEALGLPGVTETREDGTKAVRYDRLVPLLIEAIKELDTKVKSLEG